MNFLIKWLGGSCRGGNWALRLERVQNWGRRNNAIKTGRRLLMGGRGSIRTTHAIIPASTTWNRSPKQRRRV